MEFTGHTSLTQKISTALNIACSGKDSLLAVLVVFPDSSKAELDGAAVHNGSGAILLFSAGYPVPIASWVVTKVKVAYLAFPKQSEGGIAFIKSSRSIDDNPDTTLLAYVNGDHEYALFNPHGTEMHERTIRPTDRVSGLEGAGDEISQVNKARCLTISLEPLQVSWFCIQAPTELLESELKYGFIVMVDNKALFGILSGNRKQVLDEITVDPPDTEWYTRYYINISALVVTESPTYETELIGRLDRHLQNKIMCTVEVSYGGNPGFDEAIALSSNYL
ncbi:hypothetical protein Tco_0706877 [Tanacetum coccineum]|uniref:Uncharacterized protein n=1 Tax=Tanacetum coccineum TaxID=301880 RepID=A0ABQ4Y8P4_9ASTR